MNQSRSEAEACSCAHDPLTIQPTSCNTISSGHKVPEEMAQALCKDSAQEESLRHMQEIPTLFIQTVNTDEDHVHIQMEIPPSIAISDAVQKLKGISSIALRKEFKFIREMYLEKDGIWSVGYFVSSIGLNEDRSRSISSGRARKNHSPDDHAL